MPPLTLEDLKREAGIFCREMSQIHISELFGVTDWKAVWTFIEHKFQDHLSERYEYFKGNSAMGIDLPEETINTDIKVTSIKQPQSSCPFKSTRQKVYWLGYNLLVFVYDKSDHADNGNYSVLDFVSCAFVSKERTWDYQLTRSILETLENNGNRDDIIAILQDKNLPGDDITYNEIVDEIFENRPNQWYLTISNALQWRLQYSRIVAMEATDGVYKII